MEALCPCLKNLDLIMKVMERYWGCKENEGPLLLRGPQLKRKEGHRFNVGESWDQESPQPMCRWAGPLQAFSAPAACNSQSKLRKHSKAELTEGLVGCAWRKNRHQTLPLAMPPIYNYKYKPFIKYKKVVIYHYIVSSLLLQHPQGTC